MKTALAAAAAVSMQGGTPKTQRTKPHLGVVTGVTGQTLPIKLSPK